MTSFALGTGISLPAFLPKRPTRDNEAVARIPGGFWPATDTLTRVRGSAVTRRSAARDWIDETVGPERVVGLEPAVSPWVRMLERVAGVGLDTLASRQLHWLEAQAGSRGVGVGRYVAGEVAAYGYGGETASWWSGLSTEERNSWRRRAEIVFDRIEREAPAEIRRLLDNATAAGGGIKFLPRDVEELGPLTYAFRAGNVLGVGRVWIEDAEADLSTVYANIAHELGGHLEYGDPLAWLVTAKVLEMMPAGQRDAAMAGARSIYGTYAYMETEIYAELRELAFRDPTSGGDRPEEDVPAQLARLQEAFEPTVALAVVRTLRQRVLADPKVTEEGKRLLDASIARIFGIGFDAGPAVLVA